MKHITLLNALLIVCAVTTIGLTTGEFFQLPVLVRIPSMVSTLSAIYTIFCLASYMIILHGLYLVLSRKQVRVDCKK